MTRQTSDTFVFRKYPEGEKVFKYDLVAHLPGLIITQFPSQVIASDGSSVFNTVLRFDFTDDWYSILAYLNEENKSTGHYIISAQSNLSLKDGVWKGDDLILRVDVAENWIYTINGEEEFLAAVDDGWIRVYAAVNAREAIRKICVMLDDHSLPPEIMDAVNI